MKSFKNFSLRTSSK